MWVCCGISGFRSGDLLVDQSDKGDGVLEGIIGHGPTITSPHLVSSARGSLNLGVNVVVGLVEVGCGIDVVDGRGEVSFLF